MAELKLNSEFRKFYASVKEFRFYLKLNRVDNEQYVKETISSLKKVVLDFTELYNTCCNTDKKRNDFIQKFSMEIFQIHDTLNGKEMKMVFIDKKDHDKFRSLYDTFFKKCLGIVQVQKRLSYLPTLLFNKFIEGITYFHQDTTDERPVYHRELSCGAQDLTSQYKFVDAMKIKTKPLQERLLIKKFVRTCFIERLIYDSIYNNTFHQQDLGHLHELKTVEQIYEKYYRYHDLELRVRYDDDNYPIMLSITETTPELTKKETYTVSRKHDRVLCTQNHWSKDGLVRYEKVQTFKQEEPWIMRTPEV
jgi:hypothetical protein